MIRMRKNNYRLSATVLYLKRVFAQFLFAGARIPFFAKMLLLPVNLRTKPSELGNRGHGAKLTSRVLGNQRSCSNAVYRHNKRISGSTRANVGR